MSAPSAIGPTRPTPVREEVAIGTPLLQSISRKTRELSRGVRFATLVWVPVEITSPESLVDGLRPESENEVEFVFEIAAPSRRSTYGILSRSGAPGAKCNRGSARAGLAARAQIRRHRPAGTFAAEKERIIGEP